ncbi:hypothetical protein [Streptomyces sp. NBC_01207]|uniref:hypothetical protein n=1 Tax=Streptomyces sp. NBC_01207 TaxID=2903772 RepID=UPI002E0F18E8|nr:hypothetical protein OG457_30680 [Streptomyces sp. NBC_01207]
MLINDEATRQVAETVGNALGVGFTLRNAAIANGAAHIEYPDGRAVGFRPIFGGAIVQMWIIGNAKPASEGEPPTLRLLEGQTYHAAISLIDTEDDDDPADLILEKLTDDLLPAFEFKPHYVGHRPWEDVFNNALADSIAEQSSRARPSETGEEPPHADTPGEAEVREPDVETAALADVTPTVEEPAAEPDALPAATCTAATGGTEKALARPRKPRRQTTAAPSSG